MVEQKTLTKRALSVGLCGEPKTGKSHLAARFCKEFGGVYCDFSRMFMQGGLNGKTPEYISVIDSDGIIDTGEAYPACLSVGLDIANQYKVINNWTDFQNAVEFARLYKDSLGKQRIWFILDDMQGVRWHKVIQIAKEAKHKSVSKDDWKVATTDIKLLISNLSQEFNLLMINQMGDEYKEGETSGERKPYWYPSGAEYLYDVLFNISVVDKIQWTQIISSREIWQCSENFDPMIKFAQPKDILTRSGINPNRW